MEPPGTLDSNKLRVGIHGPLAYQNPTNRHSGGKRTQSIHFPQPTNNAVPSRNALGRQRFVNKRLKDSLVHDKNPLFMDSRPAGCLVLESSTSQTSHFLW